MRSTAIFSALLVLLIAAAGCTTTADATSTAAARPPSTIGRGGAAPAIATATSIPTASATETSTPDATPDQSRTMAFVNRVIDGDTIEVRIGGHLFTVRYIGIDTPETVHPSRPVEPFGLDASERNKELVAGREVILEKDVSETDRFGRLLRYVWLDEVTLVNAILVSEGLAQVSTFPPDVKYTDQFLALQELARVNQIGLWGDAPVIVEATSTRVPPTAAATPRFVVPTQPAQNCDPSYPTVCIPPFPPDLDCGEIPYRRFAVRGSDPHGFDRDRDGIGCES